MLDSVLTLVVHMEIPRVPLFYTRDLHVDLACPVVLHEKSTCRFLVSRCPRFEFPILDRTLVFIHSRILTLIRAPTDILGSAHWRPRPTILAPGHRLSRTRRLTPRALLAYTSRI